MLDIYDILVQRTTTKRTPKLNMSEEEMLKDDDVDGDKKIDFDNISERGEVQLEAPEGGWGYMICIGLSIMFIVASAPTSLLGLIFSDIFEDVEDGTSGITLVNGVFNAVVSFTGFFATIALKKLSLRQCGLIGSAFFVFGSFLTIFTKTVTFLIFTIGILEGIGFGVMVPMSMTTFNNYFVKRRTVYMGVSSVIIGSGFMIFPYLIKYCKEYYGLRGTLMILCGISCHAIFAMAIMQPVEWHLVPKIKELSVIVDNDGTSMTVSIKDDLNIDTDGKEENADVVKPLINYDGVSKLQIQSGIALLSLNERRLSLNFNSVYPNDSVDVPNLVKTPSSGNLANWTGPIIDNENIPIKHNTWKTLINFFDLKLLNDPIYSNMCLGVSFAFFSELTFFVLVPVLLYHYHFSQTDVAFCMTIAAAADLGSRVTLTLFSYYFIIPSRLIFYVGTVVILFLRIIFFQFTDMFSVVILIGFLGFFRSWLFVPLPLVFAENCPKDKFTTAYGLFMMVSGVITLFLSVIVGCLKDYTQNYMIAFHFLNICSLVMIIPWTLEFYFIYKKKNINI